MTLSTLAILLGMGFALPFVFGLLKPDEFTRQARGFHRSEIWGFILMGIGGAWFLYNFNRETLAEFMAYKKYLLLGFGGLAVASCIFVRDYLAVRGLAVTMLMVAWYTLSIARWAETQSRLVIVTWMYVLIMLAMWWTVSPWRLRDYLAWLTASPSRLRANSAAFAAFGIFVALLGLTAFRQ